MKPKIKAIYRYFLDEKDYHFHNHMRTGEIGFYGTLKNYIDDGNSWFYVEDKVKDLPGFIKRFRV